MAELHTVAEVASGKAMHTNEWQTFSV